MIIYKIVNTVNGKIYVGRTRKSLELYWGSGILVKLAIKKYGISNFIKEMIEECSDEESCVREKFWIKETNSLVPNGYNIGGGGEGGNDLRNHPDKDIIIKKISDTCKAKGMHPPVKRGADHYRFGKSFPMRQETRKKISDTCKAKGLCRPIMRGADNPMFGKFGADNPNYGKKHREGSHQGVGETMRRLHPDHCKGERNSRYGDHRNYEELHGKEKAILIKTKFSEMRAGSGNSNSKIWKLISPAGEEYTVEGTLKVFCKNYNLSMGLLKKNMRKPVIAKIIREKFSMTKNTIGWTLYEL